MKNTILIKIASYRDRELSKTIQSAIDNAAEPEKLRFAVYNQEDVSRVDDLRDWRKDSRFQITNIHWKDATGLGVPRATNDSKWDGEEYTLQIDSHMRFDKWWDKRLKYDLQSRENRNAVLSMYPPAYNYDNKGNEIFEKKYVPRRLVVEGHVEDSITVLKAFDQQVPTDRPHLLVAGGFIFSHGETNKTIPNDPHLNFGEELAYSLQLFQKGYHVYTPNDLPLWHWYGDRGGANRVWDDQAKGELKKKLENSKDLTRDSCNELVFGPDPINAKKPTRIFMKKLKFGYMNTPWPKEWPDPDNWDEEASVLWERLKNINRR